MFSRFLPQVRSLCGELIFECQPALITLLGQSFPKIEIVAEGDASGDFDIHLPLLSLGRGLAWTNPTCSAIDLISLPTTPPPCPTLVDSGSELLGQEIPTTKKTPPAPSPGNRSPHSSGWTASIISACKSG